MTNQEIQEKVEKLKVILENKRDIQERRYQEAQQEELEADAIEEQIKGLEDELEEKIQSPKDEPEYYKG